MNLQRPFQVVAPTLDGDVLTVLARAKRAATGREIERLTGGSHGGVARALAHLVSEGIVSRERVGRANLYRLNEMHLAAPYIKELARLREKLIEELRDMFEGWLEQPVSAVLFGSAARGEADATSDIDILLIRPRGIDPDAAPWSDQRLALAAMGRAMTGNDVRVLEYGEDELTSYAREPVLQSAVDEGVSLAGQQLARVLRGARAASS